MLGLISETFASAQNQLSSSNAEADVLRIRLQKLTSSSDNDRNIATDHKTRWEKQLVDARGERDGALREVDRLNALVQSLKVQGTVRDATAKIVGGDSKYTKANINGYGNTGNNGSADHQSTLRSTLQSEFDSKKLLLEDTFTQNLALITQQLKAQNAESLNLKLSAYDSSERLKLQCEITRGIERVEEGARREVVGLTKLCMRMHESNEGQVGKVRI